MLLEVSGLTTRYGSISALRDVSLSVGDGEVVGLIGPNGGSEFLAEADLFDTFVRGSAA